MLRALFLKRFHPLQILLSLQLIFLVTIGIASTFLGPRGSDQFWYSGYVACFRSFGYACTNYITPSAWSLSNELPPPIHHLYALYLAIILPFSSHANWVITNLVHLLFGFGALFAAIKLRYNSNLIACCSLSVLLAIPLVSWFTVNSLAEPIYFSYSCFFLLGIILMRSWHTYSGILFALSACFLYAGSRSDGFLLVPALLYFIFSHPAIPLGRKLFLSLCSCFSLSLAFSFLSLSKYPSHGLKALLISGANNTYGGNMLPYMSEASVSFSKDLWLDKAIDQIASILHPSGLSWFLHDLPILALSSAVLFICFYHKKRSTDEIFLLLFPLAAVALTSILHQYQVRYWFPWLPFWFLTLPSFFHHKKFYSIYTNQIIRKSFLVFIGVLSLMWFLASLGFVYNDVTISKIKQDQIASFFDNKSPCSSVMVINTIDQLPAYALMPKRVFHVDTSLNSIESINNMIHSNRICGSIERALPSNKSTLDLGSVYSVATIESREILSGYSLQKFSLE